VSAYPGDAIGTLVYLKLRKVQRILIAYSYLVPTLIYYVGISILGWECLEIEILPRRGITACYKSIGARVQLQIFYEQV
jgi:hypothetical protein